MGGGWLMTGLGTGWAYVCNLLWFIVWIRGSYLRAYIFGIFTIVYGLTGYGWLIENCIYFDYWFDLLYWLATPKGLIFYMFLF